MGNKAHNLTPSNSTDLTDGEHGSVVGAKSIDESELSVADLEAVNGGVFAPPPQDHGQGGYKPVRFSLIGGSGDVIRGGAATRSKLARFIPGLKK